MRRTIRIIVVDFDLASAKSPEAESDVGDATISFDMDSVEDADETVFDAPGRAC